MFGTGLSLLELLTTKPQEDDTEALLLSVLTKEPLPWRNYHVVPRDGAWAVLQGGRVFSQGHRTQAEAGGSVALSAAIEGCEVVYHRPNGQIRDSDSYGHDPRAIRDTRH